MKHANNFGREGHGQHRKGRRTTQTISGTVYPADWDEAGDVTALDLVTGDDQVLRIRNSEKFFDYQEVTIQAHGIIEEQHRAGKSILIKRFQVMPA
jgi:hypothetical protein